MKAAAGLFFQASWHFFCGSGFPAARIEAESLPQRTSWLADKVAPSAMACFALVSGRLAHDISAKKWHRDIN
jgi:hypothetical protein